MGMEQPAVRLDGYALDPRAPDAAAPLSDEEEMESEGLSDEEETESEGLSDEEETESEGLSDEEDEELYDSDGSEDASGDAAGSSGSGGSQLVTAPLVPEGQFLGPARFASAGSTAGFMRVAAAEADPAAGSQEEGKEILVLYRYTRFSRTWTWSRRQGVEACRRTKLHRLRFIVPPASDPASSLPWAGSSLAPLIYPDLYSEQLQELWSSLVAPVSIPPQATRVQVMVDVGILRPRDDTPERMEHMRRELEGKREEAWPGYHYHIGMKLHLPEPVLCKGDEADDDTSEKDGARPAKRRRVITEVAGEECPVCFELLESGLAAWPGCSVPHIFHGECLEQTLKGSARCPICRRELSASDQ